MLQVGDTPGGGGTRGATPPRVCNAQAALPLHRAFYLLALNPGRGLLRIFLGGKKRRDALKNGSQRPAGSPQSRPGQVRELQMDVNIFGRVVAPSIRAFYLRLVLKRGAEKGGGVFPPCA